MRLISYLLFTILLFSPLVLQAQPNSSTTAQKRTISLSEAVNLALENNFSVKQAENNLKGAEVQVLSARADYLPSITSGFNGFRNTGQQFNNATGEFGDFTINGVGASVNADYTIFDGFQRLNNMRSAQNLAQARSEDVERMREDVIFNTASAYLQVLLDKELLKIAEENLKSSELQLEQTIAQVEVGSRPISDQYNQESVVANNELEVTNRENALMLSKVNLVRQMQIDPLQEYEFTTPEIEDSQIIPRDYNLRELVNVAIENRSDLKSEEFNIQANKNQLDAAEGSLLPTFSLNGQFRSSYNDQTRRQVQDGFSQTVVPIVDGNGNQVPGRFVQFTSPDFDVQKVSFGTQFFERNVTRNVGFNVSIPIFQTFNRKNQIETQKVQYKNAQLQLQNTRLQVIQEVTQAYNDYLAATKRLESTEKAVKSNELAYSTQRERYNVGAGTQIELLNAQASYVEAQANRVQALYNFVFQQKLLDYYLGRLDKNLTLEVE